MALSVSATTTAIVLLVAVRRDDGVVAAVMDEPTHRVYTWAGPGPETVMWYWDYAAMLELSAGTARREPHHHVSLAARCVELLVTSC